MVVAFSSHALVEELEVRVAQNGDGGPMMEGVVEGLGASSPHEDLSPLATLLGNGSDTPKATKSMEVTEANGIVRVAEKGGENEGADTRHGGEDGGVGRLAGAGNLNLLEPTFEVLIDVAVLAENESRLAEQQSEVSGDSLEGSGSYVKRRLLKNPKDVIEFDSSDVM